MTRWLSTLSIPLLAVLAGAMAAPHRELRAQEADAEDSRIPPEVSAREGQWPLPNRDYANTRADLGGDISSANVRDLSVAWQFEIPPATFFFGAAAANPIVLDGR